MKTLLLLSLLVGQPAHADPAKPQDFAYGVELQSEGGGGYHSLLIPSAAYSAITRPDLGDLRIFNSKGETVPHEVRHQQTDSKRQVARYDLPIFPIQGAPSATIDGSSTIQLREDPSGKLLSVHFKESAAKTAKSAPRSYLVDLKDRREEALKALEFKWKGTDAGSMVRLRVRGGNDLTHWPLEFPDAVIAKLAFGEETLERNRLEVTPASVRYLFLTAEEAVPGFELEKVAGEFYTEINPSLARRDSTREWIELNVKGRLEGERFQYAAPGKQPITAMRISLPQPNSLFTIWVGSSDQVDGNFQQRFRGSIYRVEGNDGKELVSPPIELGVPVTDRHWMIRIEGKDSSLGEGALRVEAGWIPHEVVFLAQGAGPYTLAFGSSLLGPADFGFSSLIEGIKRENEGRLPEPAAVRVSGEKKDLGGEARLTDVPRAEIPWKKWGLWAALGAAVGLLAMMAMRLFREISA